MYYMCSNCCELVQEATTCTKTEACRAARTLKFAELEIEERLRDLLDIVLFISVNP